MDLGLDATLLDIEAVFDCFLVTAEAVVDLVFVLATDFVLVVVVMGGALLVGSTLNLLTAGSF